ncbi:MAG: NAD(P)-dependent oxidoreductase [Chloroflexia bacterium]|nr:NAD(P)-dependent oxidoreductase [Chloroflexia bacterium]
MATLVTGGNGWLPSHVVRRLVRAGEPVISYDLMEPDDYLRAFLGDEYSRVVFVCGDVTDRERLRNAAIGHGVTAIVSAAAITPRVDREQREPERIISVNLGGVVNALEVARELPGFRRFVQVSSCAVFGSVPNVTELDEDSPANAANLYGITKLAGERVALRYGDLFGLDVVAVRPSNVYGPMERVTPGYAGATELREMLRLHFDGHAIAVASRDASYRDWTYVEDVAEGIERAWSVPGPLAQRVFILASGEQQPVGDVLEAFRQHLPGLNYRVVAEGDANYRVDRGGPGPLPRNDHARDVLGWSPRTSFGDGMREYLGWIAANGPQ